MSDRTQRFIAEVGRFLAVGGAATIVALVIFNLLVHGFNTGDHALLADQPIGAFIFANSVGMGVSYYGSRHWAFRDRPPVTSDGGLTTFVAINLLTMLIPIGCLAISRDVLGRDDPFSDNLAANVIGLVLGLCARFLLFRTFVFKRPISLVEIYDEPGLVDDVEYLDGDAGSVNESASLARGRSTSGPIPPGVLGPEAD
ncbi:MAG TPA: GtrA family protein [Nocardioides sp.]|uniref:GtrA family protein n=1 Tax=uncultured Nocardioides sp. TaxID=198441 RepID=UPI00262E827B|nr:GtrA family protein [uncultured Nocardioides sp.]HRD62450.1 GtrA family protein [Nocardioides sp.]HRI95622.1 GtrA family protein [Nocardioides sp.]HRK46045.1 GtrA family protein [Nocardioides sp.]